MRLFISVVLSFPILISCKSQSQTSSRNLSFENVSGDSAIGWQANSRNDSSIYEAALDAETVKDGRYAASIRYKGGKPGFATWRSAIREKYAGDSITLSGFIKTENVTDGFAGLFLGVERGLAFDNMSNKGVKGTTDWTEYKITLPLFPEKQERILFGGILSGKGKMWMDSLKISIDGKDIAELKPIDNTPAYKDHEYTPGSRIEISSLDSNKINTLYQVGLIWGFLKYYHPGIAKGDYNWDYALFRVLPKILNASEAGKDALLCNWIDTLGALKSAGKQQTIDSSILKTDLAWITQSGFSEKLQASLWNVKNAERPGTEQYYVTKGPAGNVVFKNERPYQYLPYTDDGFQLLALYRYWNMVQYFFPYRDLIGEDWKNTLRKFIPKFLNASNELEYKLAVLELCGQIHDTHAQVNQDYALYHFFGTRYIPVKVQFVDEKPIVAGYLNKELAIKNGFQIGDQITKINNQPVEAVIEHLATYTPASNRWTQLRDIARNITRTNDSTLQVETLRNGKKISRKVSSYGGDKLQFGEAFSAVSASVYKWVANGIGYINNGKLKRDDVEKIFTEFKSAKGIIIDLRNYPSDNLAYTIPHYLLSKEAPFVKFLMPQIAQPGSFYYAPPMKVGSPFSGPVTKPYTGRVVLLVNETTQSSSEFHAMAYRTYPNCVVMGSNTAGADGNVSEMMLPGNIKTRFSGIGICYPDGTPTQRTGIVPDIVVKPTIAGIISNKDEVLEKAIQLLSK
ncbi:S41 family peptidase [Niabella drilacis]|uniref:Peptidase family S41 n=1 Tax=Niabella drilacis (strain DSM 25811 / CCM 8410 / CCUG 62505 / LMG 26954 / E90) TaxID=1285928 RepID=A0A1G7A226_NIADE|nr:S41 family peptidase [Niabella drilacis]SDE08849.1 Peptidase family S41 [Niabella drilacis]